MAGVRHIFGKFSAKISPERPLLHAYGRDHFCCKPCMHACMHFSAKSLTMHDSMNELNLW